MICIIVAALTEVIYEVVKKGEVVLAVNLKVMLIVQNDARQL